MSLQTWLAIHFGPKKDWDWLWVELRITRDIELAFDEAAAGRMTPLDVYRVVCAQAIAMMVVDALVEKYLQ